MKSNENPTSNLMYPATDERFNVSGDALFFSFQGEGNSLGYPAVFLRLQMCNLQCSWCDTPYTWKMEHDVFWEWHEISVTVMASQIIELWRENCLNESTPKRLVISGGEPLLQKNAIDLLIALLSDWIIEIETNGTIKPSALQLNRCSFNCSPKLANSENGIAERIVPEVIQLLLQHTVQFKFVVRDLEDLKEALNDFIEPFQIPPEKVVIMPEGVDREVLRERFQVLVREVLAHGFRMLPRLHVEVFGSKRRT